MRALFVAACHYTKNHFKTLYFRKAVAQINALICKNGCCFLSTCCSVFSICNIWERAKQQVLASTTNNILKITYLKWN